MERNKSLQAKYPDRDRFLRDTLSSLSRNFDLSRTTDWRDLQYQHGVTKSVGVNISGGSERASSIYPITILMKRERKLIIN